MTYRRSIPIRELAVGTAVFVASTSVAATANTTPRDVSRLGNSEQTFSTPVAAEGRLYWITAGATDPTSARISSRPLAGGKTRNVAVPLPGAPSSLTDLQLRLSDDGTKAYVSARGQSCAENSCPAVNTIATYTLPSGRLLSSGPGTDRNYGAGLNPVYIDLASVHPDGTSPIVDEEHGDTGLRTRSITGNVQTTKRFILSITEISRTTGQWRSLRVWNRQTGKTRYTVSWASVRRAAGVPDTAESRSLRLLPDGGVSVPVARDDEDRDTGVTPVAVDGTGKIRQIGRRIPRAYSAEVLLSHRRAFVTVGGLEPKSSSGQCESTWITDVQGTRGHRLPASTVHNVRSTLPIVWDGQTAAWLYESPFRDGNRPNSIRLDRHLNRLTLRRTDRPRC